MSIESMVQGFVEGLATDAKVVEQAMTGSLATSIETHIPSLGPLLGELASVAGKVTGYGEVLDWLMTGIEVAKNIGVKPMDANEMAATNEKFHAGDQTGG